MDLRHIAVLLALSAGLALIHSGHGLARTSNDVWQESRFWTGCEPGPSHAPAPPEHRETHFPALRGVAVPASLSVDLGSDVLEGAGILGTGFNLEHALWSCPDFRGLLATQILEPFKPTLVRIDSGMLPAAPPDVPAEALGPGVYVSVLSSPQYADSWLFFRQLNDANVRILLGVWGGPAQFTDDGTRLGVLDPSHYDDYVDYVVTVVDYLVREQGIQLWATTIANEPDGGDGNQIPPEGLAYIAHQLAPRVAALGVKLYGPDTANADHALQYVPELLDDPLVAENLAFIGFHEYTPSDDVGSLVNYVHWRQPELPVIVTEYTSFGFGDLDDGQEANAQQGFALDTAATVLNHYRQGVNAALYWDAVDYLQPGHDAITRWGLLRGPTENFAPRQRYFGLQQILAYLQPGAKVLPDDVGAPASVEMLAVRTDTGVPVIFVVNQEFGPVDLTVALHDRGADQFPAWIMTVTDRGHRLERTGVVRFEAGTGHVFLGPRSITTLFPAGEGPQPDELT
ncbi:MAG: hypothetical protein NVSMB2_18880 [Chloroflexota bacterium]